MMHYYKLTLAYEGGSYCGWQLQTNGMSIHQKMMEAGQGFLKDGFTITGGSRTDSGVHALGYVALLAYEHSIQAYKLCRSFNAFLPKDIVVYEALEVDENFHPRYSSKRKTYRYSIYNGLYPIPQYMHDSYFYMKKLDDLAMQEAASLLVGEHDFKAFSSSRTSVSSTVRTIYTCQVVRQMDHVSIEVCGNGFLYNMVRIIAGMLIEVGIHRLSPKEIGGILEQKDRTRTNKTAPAKGLTLVSVEYDLDVNKTKKA